MKKMVSLVNEARAYLECTDRQECDRLQKSLDRYTGDFAEIVRALRPPLPAKPETGWIKSRPFRVPALTAKYPNEQLTLYVPKDYTPAKARGLVFFLHGGGTGQPRNSGLKAAEEYQIEDLLEASGRIVCFPCSPPSAQSFAAWNQAATDDYLADVITELEHFYNLDPHDLILGGHSMGGMGAYHIAHRMPDRFHSILASAGCWDFACWPALTGTAFWIMQGINDAVMFKRRHGTDIEFARLAKLRLDQAGVPCFYREHIGHHFINRRIFREWLEWSRASRRNPFYPLVVAVTPRGQTCWTDWKRHKVPLAAYQNRIDFHEIPPALHCRWVTIDGVGPDTVIFDMVTMSDCRDECEEDWNNFTLKFKRKHVPGGIVEAALIDKQTIEVLPRNVTGFTLWLHPDMVDLKNVQVRVMGKERHAGPVKAGLGTLLESYKRRRDWGLLYPAKIRIEGDKSWETGDQLKVQDRI